MDHRMQAWALAGMLGVAAVVASDHAVAAPKKAQPAKANGPAAAAPAKSDAKPDPAAAARILETGIKAYEAGKYDAALQSLNQAMQGGGLNSQQMARALYYRGLTYRKQGKPALAISDLTSAVWLKGGLSDAEKNDAQENRAAAYQEAGLSEAPSSGGSSGGAGKAAGVPATASSWQTATTDSGASASQGSSSGGVGGFFSNIFGGGSSTSASAEPAPKPKAPPPPPAAAPAPPPAAATHTTAAVSGWSDATEVSVAGTRTAALQPAVNTPPVAPRAPVAAPSSAPAAAAAPAPTGKFRLQVAAVRSRAEAETLAARLKEKHGAQLGARLPAVDEVVLGNMGTFYRVRLGPYADANEPRQLCGSLKADGFDCLIVTK